MAGGWDGGTTATSETLVEGGSAWTVHEPLGTGFANSRILTYNNIPYMFGGNMGTPGTYSYSASADILTWDDATKKWSKIDLVMKQARNSHGVSAIVIDSDTLHACQP